MNITYTVFTNNKRIYLFYKWRILSPLHFCKSSNSMIVAGSLLFCHWFLGNLESWIRCFHFKGYNIFYKYDGANTWNFLTLKQFFGLRNTHSYWQFIFLIITRVIQLFFWRGEERRRKDSKLTHKKIPFVLILIKPNSSCFKFHNSRRVKLENVSLNNWASVFYQRQWLCWAF